MSRDDLDVPRGVASGCALLAFTLAIGLIVGAVVGAWGPCS